jgi:WD40 repeat protein
VRVWDFKQQQLLQEFKEHDAGLWSVDVRFSPDNRWLASYVHANSKVVLTDLVQRRHVLLTRNEPSGVYWAEFAPDNKTLVTGHANGAFKFWNLRSFALALTLRNGDGPGGFLAFSPDGNTLASKTAQSTVQLWKAASADEIPQAQKDRK